MNISEVMEDIEELVGDCKIAVHKTVSLNYNQQINIALAFEHMLDEIENILREAVGSDAK